VRIFLTLIFILVCVALTVVVLAQEGKDAGLGSIAGTADSYWGKNKSRSMEGNLVRFTRWLAIAFIVLTIVLNLSFF
jgi:preprotein translocase subunit SecG